MYLVLEGGQKVRAHRPVVDAEPHAPPPATGGTDTLLRAAGSANRPLAAGATVESGIRRLVQRVIRRLDARYGRNPGLRRRTLLFSAGDDLGCGEGHPQEPMERGRLNRFIRGWGILARRLALSCRQKQFSRR